MIPGGREGPGASGDLDRRAGARQRLLTLSAVIVAALVLHACANSTDDASPSRGDTAAPTTSSEAAVDHEPAADDFINLADMTAVRGFFVDNLAGDLPATLAVARSTDGGTYPVGSVVQLVPQEAMVKRAPGFSPATNDWEFFMLDVSQQGTAIGARGGAEVVNRFGGSCAGCHAGAEPQFDFVCEQGHGCEPLPIGRSVIEAIQAADPRPRATG